MASGYQVPATQTDSRKAADAAKEAAEQAKREADAYERLLLLGNKHGCLTDHCPHQDRTPGCTVHDDDVAYMREWMQALGIAPYESVPHHTPGSQSPVTVNYERP